MKPIRAAIYLRVSTVDQGRRGFSLAEQRRACLERARALAGPGPLAVDEFLDTAGGDLIERPELDRARRYVAERRPDFFICLDPDRFSRATYQAILVANEIEAAGTRLEFIQHDYQATSEGRLFFTLRVAIAEYEKAKILERTMRGKRGKMAEGGIPHGLSVYGYDFRSGKEQGSPLVPHPLEAAWVKRIFRWAAEEGLGSEGIARRLNELGVPAKRGGRWHRGVVADILRNPIYMGRLRLNRYDFTGLGSQQQLPPGRRTKRLTPVERPPSEWVEVAVPAILPDDLFLAVQRALRSRAAAWRPAASQRPPRLLSGLAVCPLCGGAMHYAWNSKGPHYLLRCSNRYGSAPRCTAKHQRASPVEEQVVHQVARWLLAEELLAAWEGQLPGGDGEEAALLAAQEQEARARQGRILAMLSKGLVDLEAAEGHLAGIRQQVEALAAERRKLQARLDDRPGGAAITVGSRLDLLLPSEWQHLLRLLLREVVVHPDRAVECRPQLSSRRVHDPGEGALQPAGER